MINVIAATKHSHCSCTKTDAQNVIINKNKAGPYREYVPSHIFIATSAVLYVTLCQKAY